MDSKMRDRGPVCECDSWGCHAQLGITWEEYDRLDTRNSVFIAAGCERRLDSTLKPVLVRPGFTKYTREETEHA